MKLHASDMVFTKSRESFNLREDCEKEEEEVTIDDVPLHRLVRKRYWKFGMDDV